MTVAAIGASVAVGAVGAGISAATGGGGSTGTQSMTNTTTLPDWMMPYAKAYLQRQYNLSNRQYQPYGGLYQQLGKEAQQTKPPDFFGQSAFQPSPQGQAGMLWNGQAMNSQGMPVNGMSGNPSGGLPVVGSNTEPFNRMTAIPGEMSPVSLGQGDYIRYLNKASANPSFTPKIVNQAAYNNAKKNAGKMFNKDEYFIVPDNQYSQYLSAQISQKQQPQGSATPLLDAYLGKNAMKGIGLLS